MPIASKHSPAPPRSSNIRHRRRLSYIHLYTNAIALPRFNLKIRPKIHHLP
uniref:Uncharacterized protein n=1 Tax=Rhizophora mucronata TaxID=61149 RepID=A0A2P2NE74_RHIMU